MNTATRVAAVIAAVSLTLLAGCSGGDNKPDAGPEIPAGTTLGEWGSRLKIDESILLVLGDKAGGTSGSVVRLQVLEVRKGEPSDLDTFTGVPAGVTPWYVSVAEHNRGPADVDTTEEMIDLLASSNAYDANLTVLSVLKAMINKTLELGQ